MINKRIIKTEELGYVIKSRLEVVTGIIGEWKDSIEYESRAKEHSETAFSNDGHL